MREIVHIQGGQCGNQIGAKFWEVGPFACSEELRHWQRSYERALAAQARQELFMQLAGLTAHVLRPNVCWHIGGL